MNLLSKTSLKDLFEDAQQRMLSQRKLVNQLQEFSEYALEKKEITDEATRNDYINAYVELAARAMVYGGSALSNWTISMMLSVIRKQFLVQSITTSSLL